jgi:regulator of extracellular matrix RemA (YlzA/DUF370 family)
VTQLVNVGHGNVVVADQIVAIVALDSLPVKRLIESAKGSTKLVDATNGRASDARGHRDRERPSHPVVARARHPGAAPRDGAGHDW